MASGDALGKAVPLMRYEKPMIGNMHETYGNKRAGPWSPRNGGGIGKGAPRPPPTPKYIFGSPAPGGAAGPGPCMRPPPAPPPPRVLKDSGAGSALNKCP